jgi:ABC-type polysaccharide/polyol phosphate export permease
LLYAAILPVIFVILFFHGRPLTWSLSCLPVLVLIQSILIAGLSLMISTWNVFYRDVKEIVGVLLMLSFYITPVFYKPEFAAEKYRFLFSVNPVAVLIQSFRDVLFYSRSPQWDLVAFAAVISFGVGALGYAIYHRQLPNVIDAL